MRGPGEFAPKPQYASWAACEHAVPLPGRCAFTVPAEPRSVRLARQTASVRLVESGIPARSVLADAAPLVVSELVTNAVRHTARASPTTRVTMTVDAGWPSIAVGDRDPRTVHPGGGSTAGGLGMVSELATAFGGGVRVERATRGRGKAVVVWFGLSDS